MLRAHRASGVLATPSLYGIPTHHCGPYPRYYPDVGLHRFEPLYSRHHHIPSRTLPANDPLGFFARADRTRLGASTVDVLLCESLQTRMSPIPRGVDYPFTPSLLREAGVLWCECHPTLWLRRVVTGFSHFDASLTLGVTRTGVPRFEPVTRPCC